MNRRIYLVMSLLAIFLLLPFVESVRANAIPQFLTEYPVPGKPQFVSVEAPNRVWFTLPEENSLGRLVVTSTTEFSVTMFPMPTVGSQPYDLEYAGGDVWFTQRAGNKIGRLQPGTGVINEYTISTPNSEPRGIDVVAGTPTHVWFAENKGNAIGQLVFTDTNAYAFNEYTLFPVGANPGDFSDDAGLEDVYYVANTDAGNVVWFTAALDGKLGFLALDRWPGGDAFFRRSGTVKPWRIAVNSVRIPWFTDIAGNQLLRFLGQTTGDLSYVILPLPDSGPYDLVAWQQYIFFTEQTGNRVAIFNDLAGVRCIEFEMSLPGAEPRGIAVDDAGHAWIAAHASQTIVEWRPPYFRRLFLPLVLRGS